MVIDFKNQQNKSGTSLITDVKIHKLQWKVSTLLSIKKARCIVFKMIKIFSNILFTTDKRLLDCKF